MIHPATGTWRLASRSAGSRPVEPRCSNTGPNRPREVNILFGASSALRLQPERAGWRCAWHRVGRTRVVRAFTKRIKLGTVPRPSSDARVIDPK